MIRRGCVMRVLATPAVSPARILPIRAGRGWREGAARAGWDGRRGAEPLTDGRGRVLVVPGWGAAGAGLDAVLARAGNGAASRPPLRQRPAGTRRRGMRALTHSRQGRRQLLAGGRRPRGPRTPAPPAPPAVATARASPPRRAARPPAPLR